MKISPISLIILVSLPFFLSGCTLKNQLKTKINESETTPSADQLTQGMTDLNQEATSSDDKEVLNAFNKDVDDDFTTEFDSLSKDLQ